VPFWLQPDKHYYGVAWYKKEIKIPPDWKNKSIQIFFERCHWQSTLWIDDQLVGHQNGLSAPHIFDLPESLSPGAHTITVRVDNRINDINPGVNSSSLTDHSQTNWNGIIGEMLMTARSRIHFDDIRLFPDINTKKVKVQMHIINLTNNTQKVTLTLNAFPQGKTPKNTFKEMKQDIELNPGEDSIGIEYEMKNALLWDEFNPDFYKISCTLTGNNISNQKDEIFGFRKLGTEGTQFTINGRKIFLRGTLECAIFPKTGYPSTNVKDWLRIFRICKDYGLNHMRFHSWCPPEAAFTAADEVGIYLYVECSSWANQGASLGDGKPVDKYIYAESKRIIKQFGNHPSFCFMAYGNEPAGQNQNEYLTKFVSYWKTRDNRRLYTGASGWPALDVNDFNSMYQPRIQLWGAGLNSIINSQPPSSDYDWENIIRSQSKPVISHEIGQWCVYPDFKEMKEYNGVLHAKNFEIFRDFLKENGMLSLADTFLTASGKLQALCYKAEIEAALRTKGMGGFQLLDLHDFPGQGTALVGVLNPFWENKGYITPGEYRQFCNTTVPLARFKKFIFNSAEDFTADIEVSNFGKDSLISVIPKWEIIDTAGKIIAEGNLDKTNIPIDNGIKLGKIRYPLNKFKSPAMYTLAVTVSNFTNKWNFWVYPYQNPGPVFGNDIKVVQKLDQETINFLTNGGKVLLTPVKGNIKPDKGGDVAVGFSSIFWNTAWTSGQPPTTLGILCNPKAPMLKDFPTQYYSNYEWWDAMSHSNAILLSALGRNIKPTVRIIDDWFTAKPLGLIIEAKVGKGKLVLTGIDFLTDAEKRPAARQLLYSILTYMRSDKFNPDQEIRLNNIADLFK
ncbi:MAG: sugar-binding domain-containing protein, partial [Ignavibacteriaceae bacterium]